MKKIYLSFLLLLIGFNINAQIELDFEKNHITINETEKNKHIVQLFYGDGDQKKYEFKNNVFDKNEREKLEKELKKIKSLSYEINTDKKEIKLTYYNQTLTLAFKDNAFSEINKTTDIAYKVAIYTTDGLQTIVEINGKTNKISFYDGDVKEMNLKSTKDITIDDNFFTGDDTKVINVDNLHNYKKDNSKKTITFLATDGTTKIKIIKFKNNELSEYSITDDLEPLVISTSITPKIPCDNCKGKNVITYNFGTNVTTYPEDYCKKPRVAGTMEFVVTGFNPFKYDVTVSDEAKNYNTDMPDLIKFAMTPKTDIKATSSNQVSDDRAIFEFVMDQLKENLENKLKELKNASDCNNPCQDVAKIIKEINDYILKIYPGYNSDLIPFMNKKITEIYDVKNETDKKKISEFKSILQLFFELNSTPTGDYVYKIPYVKNVDEYVFKLNITPKSGINAGARVLNQEIPVAILGGFKVDFSTGLYYTSLINENYIMVKDSTVIIDSDPVEYNKRNKIIKENNRSDRDFGLSALMHFYTRWTTWINPGLTIGAGVTLNDKPKLQYLAGGSLLLGKNGRLVLTYGATMGYVEKLSSRYDGMYDSNGDLFVSQYDKEVLLSKTFKVKPFVSVTYNIPIFNTKKEEVKGTEEGEKEEEKAKEEETTDEAEESEDDSDKKTLKKAIEILGK